MASAGVFRPYSGEGGLQQERIDQAASHKKIAKLVVIGQTVNGQDIVAVKVTKNARTTRDGQRPATVYTGAQHAREWITPEMVRRLLDRVLSGYGFDPTITDPVNTTEMWFIPVVNPTGTTSRSPATGCGARTCTTTTMTASSRPATAST